MAAYPYLFVLSTSRQEPTIGTEANTSDIEISIFIHRLILQGSKLLAIGYLKDLCRSIASSSDFCSIVAKSNATNHAFMGKIADQLDIKHASDVRIEDCIPVLALALLICSDFIGVQFRKHIANVGVLRGRGAVSGHWWW